MIHYGKNINKVPTRFPKKKVLFFVNFSESLGLYFFCVNLVLYELLPYFQGNEIKMGNSNLD